MSSLGSDLKCLEHSTLKVPYEILNKRFRAAQKALDREAAYVTQSGAEIEKLCADSITPTIINSEEDNDKENPEDELEDTEDFVMNKLTNSDCEQLSQMMDDNSESNNSLVTTEKSSDSTENNEKKVLRTKPIKGKEVSKLLNVLVDRLTTLKRKAGESIADELEAARVVRKRVQHLKTYNPVAPDGGSVSLSQSISNASWRRTRLNRMLVDHLLREGMYTSARKLAEYLDIKDLTNIEVFWAAKEVEESLKRHESKIAVNWCYENKSKLRKIKSTFELEIRVQEFVELVRSGKKLDAVKYARKYLAESDSPEHMTAVKKCMGLLAFPIDSTIQPYSELFSDTRWNLLVTHFRQEHARLYQLTSTSVLGAVVQAGLASLKTPQCYRTETKSPNCPVCTNPLSALASVLPYAHCAHSQLVCAISGEPLNENNPPLVLPSGYVYGARSLNDMARTNSGKVICSRSGRIFDLSEAEKVFVM